MAYYAPVPSAVRSREHATRMLTDELHSTLIQVPTLYERVDLRAHVAMNPVFRGADLLTVPNLGTFGDMAEEVVEGMVGGGSTKNPGLFRETDQNSVHSLIGALRDHGVPDVQDSRIPLILAHPSRSGAELRRLVRDAVGESPSQLDIVPLIEALLKQPDQ